MLKAYREAVASIEKHTGGSFSSLTLDYLSYKWFHNNKLNFIVFFNEGNSQLETLATSDINRGKHLSAVELSERSDVLILENNKEIQTLDVQENKTDSESDEEEEEEDELKEDLRKEIKAIMKEEKKKLSEKKNKKSN
jgi:HSP90 family molecular chaperone